MLDWCDAMDIQWKDTLELILLVGPFTTWENRKNKSRLQPVESRTGAVA
jgi:hypothetical protein